MMYTITASTMAIEDAAVDLRAGEQLLQPHFGGGHAVEAVVL